MRWHDYNLVTYIDDNIGIAPASDALSQFNFLSDPLTRLDISMNPDKGVPPCKALTCLGIQVDISASCLCIDYPKFQSIPIECFQVSGKNTSRRRNDSHFMGS